MARIIQILFSAVLASLAGVAIHSAGAEDGALPLLRVLAYPNQVESYRAANGSIRGEAIDKVRDFLDARGLDYVIQLLPWVRAYNQATTRDDSLVMLLARNPDRENEFYWLLQLKDSSSQLLTRNDPDMLSLTKEEIVSGEYRAICEVNSAQCRRLTEFGFAEDQIMVVTGLSAAEQARLVQRQRVDFIISQIDHIGDHLVGTELFAAQFAVAFELGPSTAYLAAHKGINARLLERLTSQIDE